ncbi:MAG: VWA domain-containing protein [Pseudomonadota bacterium]
MKQTPIVRRAKRRGRIVFALDATMSRAPTWRLARQVQSEMFVAAEEMGGLEVQVVFFRGQGELRKSAWTKRSGTLADRMSRVQCRSGLTQIARVLKHTATQAEMDNVDALVYIGDAVEENPDLLGDLAGKLGLRNVKLFAFQEGQDRQVETIMRDLARLTNGAYAHFDTSSPDTLKALLRAVGAYAAGGLSALKSLASKEPEASALLRQIPSGDSAAS